jgi:hypothetical protein
MIVIIVLVILLILLLLVGLASLYVDPYVQNVDDNELYPICEYPNGSLIGQNIRNRVWVDECKKPTNFIIQNSEWPTFLTWKAWDSCQGCPSLGGGTDHSGQTFQVIGDWMRISILNGNDGAVVSGANSKQHWFNPPRNDSDDKPLEMEWYMYMDGSAWGNTPDELINSKISFYNWSAFWAFGHGVQEADPYSGWPTGGEWDIAEWLPYYGKGCTSGLHNGVVGAYPPCCLKQDGIMYPIEGPIKADKAIDDSGLVWPDGSKQGVDFATWGSRIKQKEDPSYVNNSYNETSVLTYNNVMHCYLRCTTKRMVIWVKRFADPTNPPNITITSDMSDDDVDKIFSNNGYVAVCTSYADFGSNNDTQTMKAFPGRTGKGVSTPHPTNWHQNMFLVWNAVLFDPTRPSRLTPTYPGYNKPITFYLSDIQLRGGGNYTKAVAPTGSFTPEQIRTATETTDPNVNNVCPWIGSNKTNDGNPVLYCNNRLQQYASDQYRTCVPPDKFSN